MVEMVTVSRKRYQRESLVIGVFVGFGMFFGFLLVIIPKLQLHGFEGLMRPLVMGVATLFMACALPYVLVRSTREAEPKIGNPSPKRARTLLIAGFVFEAFFLTLLCRLYNEVREWTGVVILMAIIVVLHILGFRLSRWAKNTP